LLDAFDGGQFFLLFGGHPLSWATGEAAHTAPRRPRETSMLQRICADKPERAMRIRCRIPGPHASPRPPAEMAGRRPIGARIRLDDRNRCVIHRGDADSISL